MFSLCDLEHSWPIEWYDEIDSTSALAARRAVDEVLSPVWFAAKHQTAGRGRLGRRWISETGNLYTTVLLPLDALTQDVACLSLSVGLAVRDTVIDITQGRIIPGLKWPNDVRIDGAKLCGILLESGRSKSGQIWLSIGIGLNLAYAPQIPDYGTASVSGILPDLKIPQEAALIALDNSLRRRLIQFMQSGRAAVIADWMRATDQVDALCRTKIGEREVTGIFDGLDEYGHLWLKTSTGDVVTITAGDVELVKEG